MDLRELYGTEDHPVYQEMQARNIARYYGFLLDAIEISIQSGQTRLSHSLIRAVNFHAIAGLHEEAGQYRSRNVRVNTYLPPDYSEVHRLMGSFIVTVNSSWENTESTWLAAYALWRINNIHPFINGNGRTARAICYYVLCVKLGSLLPGRIIIPEMLSVEPDHSGYVENLGLADRGNLEPLASQVGDLMTKQITA